ncbi:MAG: cbb3-type cytochrome c oxidase subunit I [Flavobacteriaceae bacterium]|nr:cbb3-type cytochrome c oxidase subunit I [Flavobacteriaceae bacterium]
MMYKAAQFSKNKFSLQFILLSLFALILGNLFGVLAGFQYIIPDFLKELLPFTKMRPFHDSSVTSWIVLAATGSIYFVLSNVEDLTIFSPKLTKIHFYLFLIIGILIFISIGTGYMGGREYVAFMPILIVPILLGWILFGYNYFKTVLNRVKNWPVYYWMWGTGIVFMIFHLAEAHFWFSPYFRENFVRDLTVQWKSYGSFVGSWNQLVYGLSIYIMAKIKNDDSVGRGKLPFFFYFLGLTNLMFGWAHHTYIIPTQPWIRYVAYGISMTEWIILGYMIYSWKKSLSEEKKENNTLAYQFLMAADFWIFINLILALLISIPIINFFSHGTHITVAHSMGTTIGINTTILLSSLFYIASRIDSNFKDNIKQLLTGFYIFNGSLIVFFGALIAAGLKRSEWMYFSKNMPFAEMKINLANNYYVFLISGIVMFIGILMLTIPLFKVFLKAYKISAKA